MWASPRRMWLTRFDATSGIRVVIARQVPEILLDLSNMSAARIIILFNLINL